MVFKQKFNILTIKGVYPYDYVSSSMEKLNETQLPPKSEFYSKLNNENISDSDYEHAQKVGKHLIAKQSEIIMIFISNLVYYFLLMYLRIFEKLA